MQSTEGMIEEINIKVIKQQGLMRRISPNYYYRNFIFYNISCSFEETTARFISIP